MKYMWVSSVYNFYFNGLMEPHMIDNYIHYVFAFEFNHLGFILFVFIDFYVFDSTPAASVNRPDQEYATTFRKRHLRRMIPLRLKILHFFFLLLRNYSLNSMILRSFPTTG